MQRTLQVLELPANDALALLVADVLARVGVLTVLYAAEAASACVPPRPSSPFTPATSATAPTPAISRMKSRHQWDGGHLAPVRRQVIDRHSPHGQPQPLVQRQTGQIESLGQHEAAKQRGINQPVGPVLVLHDVSLLPDNTRGLSGLRDRRGPLVYDDHSITAPA